MTEQELCLALGLLEEPCHNRIALTEKTISHLLQVSQALTVSHQQKEMFGSVGSELWLDFLPWHSLN
jgi:hypothetical protein